MTVAEKVEEKGEGYKTGSGHEDVYDVFTRKHTNKLCAKEILTE